MDSSCLCISSLFFFFCLFVFVFVFCLFVCFVFSLISHVTGLWIFGMSSELVFVLCDNYLFSKVFLFLKSRGNQLLALLAYRLLLHICPCYLWLYFIYYIFHFCTYFINLVFCMIWKIFKPHWIWILHIFITLLLVSLDLYWITCELKILMTSYPPLCFPLLFVPTSYIEAWFPHKEAVTARCMKWKH